MMTDGMNRTILFVLVAMRFTGVFSVGWLFGHQIIPFRVRIGLIILLSLIVTSALPTSQLLFFSLPFEKPTIEPTRYETRTADLTWLEASSTPEQTITSLSDIVTMLMNEGIVGFVMGSGIFAVLAGLRLSGEWIDRHSGIGLGKVLHPELDQNGSSLVEFLPMFGIATILLMEPSGGHLLLTRTILESFRSIPVGGLHQWESFVEFLNEIVKQSLVLGLRVALPLVVVMSLFEFLMGLSSRISRFSTPSLAVPLRIGISLVILAVTWPGMSDSIVMTVINSLDLSRSQLVHAAGGL